MSKKEQKRLEKEKLQKEIYQRKLEREDLQRRKESNKIIRAMFIRKDKKKIYWL